MPRTSLTPGCIGLVFVALSALLLLLWGLAYTGHEVARAFQQALN